MRNKAIVTLSVLCLVIAHISAVGQNASASEKQTRTTPIIDVKSVSITMRKPAVVSEETAEPNEPTVLGVDKMPAASHTCEESVQKQIDQVRNEIRAGKRKGENIDELKKQIKTLKARKKHMAGLKKEKVTKPYLL
jgi:hypothetical protein